MMLCGFLQEILNSVILHTSLLAECELLRQIVIGVRVTQIIVLGIGSSLHRVRIRSILSFNRACEMRLFKIEHVDIVPHVVAILLGLLFGL